MRFDGNDGGAVNYEPNSFGGPVEDPSFKEPPLKIASDAIAAAFPKVSGNAQEAGWRHDAS